MASGALPEPERAEIENHLAACADCRKYYEELKTITESLANWERDLAHVQPGQIARSRWAGTIQSGGQSAPIRRPTPAAGLLGWWHDVVWSSRRVWAGLAAVWVVILAGNLALREPAQTPAMKSSYSSQEMAMTLKYRQSILAELLADHGEPRDADRRKFVPPKPRTERLVLLSA